MDNNYEEWRDVKGFEGVYKISNLGRLMSLKRGKNKILSETNKKGGYYSVVLNSGSETKYTRIHRLVYEAFIGELPTGRKYHIHHKDHNKQNNRVENLILLTAKEHYYEDIDSRNVSGMNYYNQHVRPRKIKQLSLDGKFINIFSNAKEASRATGVCSRNILQMAAGVPFDKSGTIRKSAGGYKWEFA